MSSACRDVGLLQGDLAVVLLVDVDVLDEALSEAVLRAGRGAITAE